MFDKRPPHSFSRRHMLRNCSIGFGSVALADLCRQDALATRPLDHPPRAKHVIFCYMSGGVSHVDSFDPKPELKRLHGNPMPVAVQRTQFNQNGNVMASPFEFKQYGECGMPVSDIFPRIGELADELAVVRSMTSPVNEHAQGNFFMHSGFPFMGHPSAGAWCSYGLGSANEDLPAYVVLESGNAVPPHGGVALYSNGFLPGQHQGSIMKADRRDAIRNIRSPDPLADQRRRLDFAEQLDRRFLDTTGSEAQVEAAIANYETAFRMQTAVPELCDLNDETQETLTMYGIDSDDDKIAAYGRQCLLARRLVQRGVRFVELSCLTRGIGAGGAANPWDQHSKLEQGHRQMALQVDQPIAALIKDLRRSGLLDETVVVWAGEFGRTPFSQGSDGRDHNPFAFSIWMCGGGIKGGTIHGVTDELGYHVVDQPCEVYDMWATVLHLLGINHKELTYRHAGRDFRLTDVFGNVIRPIIA